MNMRTSMMFQFNRFSFFFFNDSLTDRNVDEWRQTRTFISDIFLSFKRLRVTITIRFVLIMLKRKRKVMNILNGHVRRSIELKNSSSQTPSASGQSFPVAPFVSWNINSRQTSLRLIDEAEKWPRAIDDVRCHFLWSSCGWTNFISMFFCFESI